MWRALLMSSLLLAGCTSNKIIRPAGEPCEIRTGESAADQSCAKSHVLIERIQSAPAAVSYDLAIAEFDDKGVFRDRGQLDSALKTIKSYKENVDVVMFVHGWHHNAEQGDSNLENFQRLLGRLAKRSPTRHIVGVYAAWRGETLTIPVVNSLTFWDRKSTSIDVGRGSVYELIERLRLELSPSRISNSKLITIGHSFGASVMLSISKNEVYRDLIGDRDSVAFGPRPLDPLTILINPAIEAMHFLSLYELPEETARLNPDKYATPRGPRIAVFMSESDSATKVAFRIGRVLSTIFENHEVITRKNRRGEPVEFSEFEMDTQALGHYKPFITHDLATTVPGSKAKECDVPFTSWKEHLKDSVPGEGWTANFDVSGTKLVHRRNSPAFSPVWVVKVAEDLISDHSEIWDTRFNCFMEELVLTR